MYLSTAQETGGSLNWSLTDEGKLRANLLLMFAFSYEIKVFLWMLFQVLETAVEIGIKLLSDFHSSQTVPPSSSRPCSLVLSWVQSDRAPQWAAPIVPWKAELSWWLPVLSLLSSASPARRAHGSAHKVLPKPFPGRAHCQHHPQPYLLSPLVCSCLPSSRGC